MTPPSSPDTHPPGCGAHPLEAKGANASTAGASMKAFGDLLGAIEGAGALDARTKEIVLFALVVYSRCEPCLDSHYEKARALGIEEAEMDEAAWCAIAMGGAPVYAFFKEAALRRRGATEEAPKVR